MDYLKNCITSFLILVITGVFAQNDKAFIWPNGAKAAIALTYDDGLSSHVHTVVPMLKTYGFKATVYPTMSSLSLFEDMNLWKDLVLQGHELGNHTIYHPCQKSKAGMEWVKDYHDLDNYALEQISEEIQVANSMLMAIDRKKLRTFAYPCAHYFAGGESYKDIVSSQFTAARDSSEEQQLVKIADIDLFMVPSWAPQNIDGDQLIAYIQKIIDNETFSTLTFHGIGAEFLTISIEAHEQMLKFLDVNRDKIWVATFKEITNYLESKRNKQGN